MEMMKGTLTNMAHRHHHRPHPPGSLLFRHNGSPRPAFWGPIAFLALAVIGLAAIA
jgi:hypothetical protein